jgi:hypothetical protein
LLIADANAAEEVAGAWHAAPEEAYDFNTGTQRIEVKSAAGGVRQHYFTLEQLQPPTGVRMLVCSVFVERAGGGLSVAELASKARSKVAAHADRLLRIDQVVAASLGQGWRNGLEDRFDYERARDSLAFFWPARIPSVAAQVPAGVSDVRFRSDLSGIPAVGTRELQEAGGLFRAALPMRPRGRGAV